MDFSKCDPPRPNVDNADCQDTWVVPADTQPGIHTLMWWWEFNQGEFYNSCADVNILRPGVPFPTAAPTSPTAQPTPGSGGGAEAEVEGATIVAVGPNVAGVNKRETIV